MNYFNFHIGDYAAATMHLSLVEDAIFQRLLRKQYLEEKALPAEIKQCARLVGARTESEIESVQIVLDEFFTLTEDGWVNKRAMAEIQAFSDKSNKAKASIAKRWSQQKPNSEDASFDGRNTFVSETYNGRNSNQEPITNNQEPIPKGEGSVVELGEPGANEIRPTPLKTGAVCIVLKSEGIGAVNPSHPELIALINAGAEVGHFAEVAKACAAKGKPDFAYVLATVKGQIRDAAAMAKTVLSRPRDSHQQPQSFATQDAIREMLRWEQMTNSEHPDWHLVGGRPNQQTPDQFPVVDMGAAIEVQGVSRRISA